MLQDYKKSAIGAPIFCPARAYLFTILTAVLLAGCQTAVAPGAGSDGVSFKVGENAIGEACRVVSAAPDADLPQGVSAYQIFCGQWEQPSAAIYRTTDTASALELATQGWWRTRLDTTFNCESPIQTSILDDIPATALDCTFRVGGWPNQALVTQVGDEVFLADSLLATYPVVERSIGVLTGKITLSEATEQGSLSSEIQRLEASLAGAAYSVGDLQRYRNLLRLAQYYNFQGLFPEAEERYREALAIHQKVLPGGRGGLGFLYMNIALQLSNQERFREADALFDEAENLLQHSLEPTDEATLVSYRAIHLANQREDKAALDLARQATQSRRELAQDFGYTFPAAPGKAITPEKMAEFALFTPEQGSTGDVLVTRAATAVGDVVQSQSVEAAMLIEVSQLDAAEEVRQLDAAERVLAEASVILARESTAPRRWVPKILIQQARVAELRGNQAAAERLLTEAIEVQQSLFSKSRTEGLAYLALGRVYTSQGRVTEALDVFRSGFAIIAERGGGLLFEDALPFFRVGLAEAKRNPAERDALHAEMFEVGQMIRGPLTAQWMARTAARLAAGDQEVSVLIRELEAARRKRDQLREQLTVAQADLNVLAPQIEALESEWQTTSDRIASLERQVQAAAPRYNQLIDIPVSAHDVLGALQPDEALVQILLGTKTSIGFFIDSTGIEVYEIDITEKRARTIVSKLRSPFETTGSLPLPEFPVADSHALYLQLFTPIAERLARAGHVVTVPTGPLLSLPFGLFVTEPPPKIANRDYTQVAWMAREHALTLTPSVQSFVNLRQTITPSRANQALIGFGDFVPHRNPDAVLASLGLPESCRKEAILIADLSTLPGTAEEVRGIAASIGAPDDALFLGTAFSEDAVKQADLADYRIVYFATHGLLPHKLQCLPQPALATSKSAQEQARGDGLLMTEEVVEELSLDADLVVLSACDTGGPGDETGGEALSGLARAFFYAGARSLLVSHWEVPDKSTMRLLTGTFERLTTQDVTLAEALRESQVALIEKPSLSHPLAWAGFTVVGDGALRLSPGVSSPTRTADSGD
jgi:CHAT domain-containing protein